MRKLTIFFIALLVGSIVFATGVSAASAKLDKAFSQIKEGETTLEEVGQILGYANSGQPLTVGELKENMARAQIKIEGEIVNFPGRRFVSFYYNVPARGTTIFVYNTANPAAATTREKVVVVKKYQGTRVAE